MDEEIYREDDVNDDGIQHGIDDDPEHDAEKGAVIGGLGGAVAGAAAGSMTGPMGALAGAAIGGVAGAVASGLGVAAVDRFDNDDTVSGIGDGSTPDVEHEVESTDYSAGEFGTAGTSFDAGLPAQPDVDRFDDMPNRPITNDAYSSTSGVEEAGDLAVGQNENTGARRVAQDWNMGDAEPSRDNYDPSMDSDEPGIQTGGTNADGSPDTRGIMEKTADAVTGDKFDDKTGKPI